MINDSDPPASIFGGRCEIRDKKRKNSRTAGRLQLFPMPHRCQRPVSGHALGEFCRPKPSVLDVVQLFGLASLWGCPHVRLFRQDWLQ